MCEESLHQFILCKRYNYYSKNLCIFAECPFSLHCPYKSKRGLLVQCHLRLVFVKGGKMAATAEIGFLPLALQPGIGCFIEVKLVKKLKQRNFDVMC